MNIKQQLYNHCQKFVNQKLETIQKTILSNKEALNSETKSSAGDKHETGRAMLQLEMEKAGQQLKVVHEMQLHLSKINPKKVSKNSCLGSLVQTNQAIYYLAISMGQITIDNNIYFAISIHSPIGKLLLGKEKGDKVIFNNQQISIEELL